MPCSVADSSNLGSLYFDEEFQRGPVDPYVSDLFEIVHIKGEKHGRGIVAKKNIPAGTCLFAIPATISVDVNKVFEEWSQQDEASRNAVSLERLADRSLHQQMLETLQRAQSGSTTAIGVTNSFLVLEGISNDGKDDIPSRDTLLGRNQTAIPESIIAASNEDSLLQIVRRNAFGPDFVTYSAMVRNYNQAHDGSYRPHRMLGLYPLADMMNHSCQPNALRVFVGETMVVHTSSKIAAGEEIFLSYVPPVFPYLQRQSALEQNHGFVCRCSRCVVEVHFWQTPSEKIQEFIQIQEEILGNDLINQLSVGAVQTLEESILPSTKPNELQRYIRLGFTQLYLRYLNHVLATKEVSEEDLLRLCMQMHFGFVACGNASTEHLSILHLCYELIGKLHSQSSDQSKTLPKLRFWTEQVKQACMVRYGNMGNDIQTVRKMMQHTRVVLRTQGGMTRTQYPFI